MHEMFGNWSLPWQTLQRSLAEAFGAEAESSSRAKATSLTSHKPASSPASWLVRARSSALQIRRAGQ
jgi:hypothetical protein